jgi:hypothetical protein
MVTGRTIVCINNAQDHYGDTPLRKQKDRERIAQLESL